MYDGQRVLVTVGTDHHPFTRLVGWTGELIERGLLDAEQVFVQHGGATPLHGVPGAALTEHEELATRARSADVIIGQCGPGTVLDALRACRVPIVVPRRRDLGEHVDDHQIAFARFLAERRTIILAEDLETLATEVAQALDDPHRVRLDEPGDLGADPSEVAARLRHVEATLTGARPHRRVAALLRARRAARGVTSGSPGQGRPRRR